MAWRKGWVVGALALAGCGGNGDGLCRDGGRPDAEGYCADNSTPSGEEERPLYSVIQTEIFDRRCTLCHYGPNASSRLDLTAETSYQNLVGIGSVQVGGILRVAPRDPDNSYLVIKLAESDPRRQQTRMPRDGPYLTEEEVQYVRDWIHWGAIDNRNRGGQ